jgi:F420-dependent oxidoreductase-like protein
LRIGTDISQMLTRADTIETVVRAIDASNVYSLWVPDHFFGNTNFARAEDPQMEAYTLLSFIAGLSRRVRLGTLVTSAVYRPPGLLAKMLTTLDVVSNGRCYAGLGVAWFEQEALGLGVPFYPLKERFERLEEVVQILRQMWSDDDRPYIGKHYRLEHPMNHPGCVQRPHPPLLIAGGGERKTLPMVARYADACNLLAFDLAIVGQKLRVLKSHCERLRRSYDAIERTVWLPVDANDNHEVNLDETMARLRTLAGMGVDHAILTIWGAEGVWKVPILDEIARLAEPLVSVDRMEPLDA